jgi:DNA-binding response OmpR family regulator
MRSLTRQRVLYADDNEDDSLMLIALLGFSNVEVKPAKTANEAFQLAEAEQFDLYLLDNRLPDGSGLELCRKLRESNSQIPIVFYSGDAGESHKQAGLAAGADTYLVKPAIDEVTATIFQHLNGTS